MFAEKIRPDAAETIKYFHDQGVTLKVISGDNPRTVAAVAARVGLPGATEAMDARELPEDPQELAEVVETHSVFGRVTPHQKRAMVGALQLKGHVVAMTGDGVNDALALKDADIGVAMGSGAAATRAVAQLVLLDGKFAVLPGVVAEGRRVIANIERSANLFVTKTVYATFLADRGRDRRLEVSVPASPPHDHQHVHDRDPGLLPRASRPTSAATSPGSSNGCLRFTVPAGIVAFAATMVSYGVARFGHDLVLIEARTTATLVLGRGRPVGARDPGATVQLVEDGAGRVDGRRHGADARDPRSARLLRVATPAE